MTTRIVVRAETTSTTTVFIIFALIFAASAFRTVRMIDGNAESVVKAVAAVSFTLLMAYFGINSFLRARKISRS